MAGTKEKKGQKGNAVQYMTRNQTLKKLQLKLAEFRRLCILKGIHPREPKKKVQGQNKTYYHVKDVNYLLHEPLLKKIRELYAYEKKVRKARAKKNRDLAQRLAERRPTYRLDHLVRERYPSFVDALRDLDDPLTMLHLFAVLPAEKAHGIPAAQVHTARRLALEWQAWVVRAHALRKVFVSVKGYYYQAEVLGQAVTWLVPHQLSQVLPTDVDYRVMLTFLEFYTTLVQFVNFKLYHSRGLRYPPVLDPKLEQAAAGLAAVMKDLAAGTQQQQQQGQFESPAAAGVAAEEAGAERGVSSEAQQRLASLSDKVRQLEQEIRGERRRGSGGGAKAAAAAGGAGDEEVRPGAGHSEEAGESEEEEEEEVVEIDSGEEGASDDEDEEEEEEEDDASEDEAGEDEGGPASDPEDADIGLPAPAAAAAAAPAAQNAAAGAGADAAAELVGGAADVDADDDAAVCASLFKAEGAWQADLTTAAAPGPQHKVQGLVFFLGREVPREQLLFVIRAFGGEAAWDGEGSPHEEAFEGITHQVVVWSKGGVEQVFSQEPVVDRPNQARRFTSREYVQPQWAFDSANFRVLVKPQLYAPGRQVAPRLGKPRVVDPPEGRYAGFLDELVCQGLGCGAWAPPPHLSPFVVEEEEGYMPEYGQQLKQLQEAARAARKRRAGALIEGSFLGGEEGGEGAEGRDGGEGGQESDELAAAERRYAAELAKELQASKPGDAEAGSDSSGEEEEPEATGGSIAEEAEAQHQQHQQQPGGKRRRRQQQQQQQASTTDDAAALKDVMMTRKTRKLYQSLQRQREAKRQRVEQLEAKAKALKK
ncbi:hypothetical protein N2152v2_007534 [Parachlorella kessleri]